MSAVKRIWAWITNGRLVWLKDFDGVTTLSIASMDPWGEWTAKRWWPFKTQIVVLKDDGKVEGCSYVRRWIDDV